MSHKSVWSDYPDDSPRGDGFEQGIRGRTRMHPGNHGVSRHLSPHALGVPYASFHLGGGLSACIFPFAGFLPILPSSWNHLFQPEPTGNADYDRQAHRVVAFSLAMLVWVPVFATLYFVLGAPICGNLVLSGGVFIFFNQALLHCGKSPALCGNVLTAAAWFVYTSLAVFTGGPARR